MSNRCSRMKTSYHTRLSRTLHRNPDRAETVEEMFLHSSYDSTGMPTTRLSSKGQVVIPKHVREAHGWEPGQAFEIIEADEGVILRPKSPFPETTFDQVVGVAQYDGPRVPTADLTGSRALRKSLEDADA